MTDTIFDPTPEIFAHHKRWKRNRDVITGSDAVKAFNAGYLPRIMPIQDRNSYPETADESYRSYLQRTPFFPASSRVMDGLMGMIFRKAINITAPNSMVPLLDTITRNGMTISDICEEIVSESLITNFTGLYVDLPAVAKGASKLEAEKSGVRPFMTMYKAESILEVTPDVIDNVRKLVRVRLLDNDETVRELLLKDGIYQVIIHTKDKNGQVVASAPFIPTRKGQPLNEIPFNIVSTKPRAISPQKAMMDDICELNIELFKAQANSANSQYYYANPMFVFYGIEAQNLKVSAGSMLFLPPKTAESGVGAEILQAGGGDSILTEAVETLKAELSIIGSRILAPDTKAGVESAEALMLRKTSENSVIASQTRTINRGINEAVNRVSWWIGDQEILIEISTDFIPAPMTPEERAMTVAEWQAGLYSRDAAIAKFIEGEVLPPTFDAEADAELIDALALNADRPVDKDVSE